MWDRIAAQISEVTGIPFQPKQVRSVGGGCINQGYYLSDDRSAYFVKTNRASELDMFESEALGLKDMWDTHSIRVPYPVCTGTTDKTSYIVMEWVELGGKSDKNSWEQMGYQLAQMHRCPGPGEFGWRRNNTIGSTLQINTWTQEWANFWQEHRMAYQFQLASRRGGDFPRQQEFLETIPQLLAGHYPQPSLVHGDLWGGNATVTADGQPIIFDPAAYYGDREVDIAMTELFGGFSPDFYRGYNQAWPLSNGYERRKKLYNLYHIINHFNIFGGGYEYQANRIIDELLDCI
jgi:fructosamine-3-kinase